MLWAAVCVGFLRLSEGRRDDGTVGRGVRPGGPLEHGRRGCGRSERTYVDTASNKAAKDGPLSFRSEGGVATTAAKKGMGDAVIKTLGRWESVAYQQYVQIPSEQLASYSAVLAS